MTIRILAILTLLACAAHAADGHAGHKPPAKHDRKSDRGAVSLDVCADGNRVHLLLGTREPGAPQRLAYLFSSDGGETWTDPAPVGIGQPAPEPAHRGMDAQIAAFGDRVVIVWTTEGKEDRFGRGPMASAFSADGGKTWSAGPNPADDGAATGHAFLDVAADDAGAFHLVWLDGRDRGSSAAGAAVVTPSSNDRTTRPAPSGKGLRYARSTDGGATWSANATLDPQTCECCWNTITTAPGGNVLVLYRDFSPRDMALVRSRDGGRTWDAPATVGAFGWDVNGCPHVGGGLAVGDSPDVLFAAVWTAKDNHNNGAYALCSRDGGRHWTSPLQLGNADSWHPDVAFGHGKVVAAWDAHVDGGTRAFAASSSDGGTTWSAPEQLNDADASATHPRVIKTPDGFRVFWTERTKGQGSRWTMRKLAPP